jgi:hypothetical protein
MNVSDQIQAQLRDPGLAHEEFNGLSEPLTWEQVVDRLLNFDLVVHRWDIANGMDSRSNSTPPTWRGPGHRRGHGR